MNFFLLSCSQEFASLSPWVRAGVQVFASLGRFIPRSFIFDVMVNGIVSYISL